MSIDVEKVDAKIRKLEQLKRLASDLASDPELMSLLETVMVNGSTSEPAPAREPAKEINGRNIPKPPADRAVRGAVIGAIKAAAMRCEKPFSGYALAEKMQAEGFAFVSKKPGLAVIECLKSLQKKGVVRVSRRGIGSNPTL